MSYRIISYHIVAIFYDNIQTLLLLRRCEGVAWGGASYEDVEERFEEEEVGGTGSLLEHVRRTQPSEAVSSSSSSTAAAAAARTTTGGHGESKEKDGRRVRSVNTALGVMVRDVYR